MIINILYQITVKISTDYPAKVLSGKLTDELAKSVLARDVGLAVGAKDAISGTIDGAVALTEAKTYENGFKGLIRFAADPLAKIGQGYENIKESATTFKNEQELDYLQLNLPGNAYNNGKIAGEIGTGLILGEGAGKAIGKVDLNAIKEANAAAKADAAAVKQAKIDNNVYSEGASSSPAGLQTSSGVIPAVPNKTTTVLGTYVSDTNSIINNQIKMVKNNDITQPNVGGFNLLNTDDSLFAKLGADGFWEQVNKPFLDVAVKRGDEIVLATKPTQDAMYRSGQLSGFGKEVKYLENQGYKYDPNTLKMVKGK